MGNDPFDARAKRSIEGVVRREEGIWRADIAVRSHADESEPPLRELKSTAQDCKSLSDAVVLAVALTIDPEAALAAPPNEETPSPAPAPTPAPVRVPERKQVPAPAISAPAPPPRVRSGEAAASVVGQAGLLPHASFGAGLRAAATLSDVFELGLQARLFPAARGSGETRFEIGATSGTLELCGRWPSSSNVRLGVCAGPSIAVVHAVLLTGERAQPGQRAWAGAELGADLDVGLSSALAFVLGARAVVPFTRYRFTVDGSGAALYRQAVLAGVAQAALELRFGAN